MSVFHLKYRPGKVGELDLGSVAKTLKTIFKSKEIPQSFLFAGPKGSGKTSAARIVSRLVNCLEKKDTEPCDNCQNCKEILGGNSMDVIEIDAASNRGIEDIRSLKEKAYLMPSKLSKKVFIIDEVHMLTKEAFNALLKLIEEPPIHTVFILCTTDPEKIPETVLSRLFRVDFSKGGKDELLSSLQRIIKGEGIEIVEEAKNLIVDKSDGSFRNLQRTFNEIYLRFGKKIGMKQVEEFFSEKTGDYKAADFEVDLGIGAADVILEKLEVLAKKGIDFTKFREEVIIHFQRKFLEDSNEKRFDIKRLLELLIKAGEQEKWAVLDQLPLELAVVEYLGQKTPKDSERQNRPLPGATNGEQQVINDKQAEVSVEEEPAGAVSLEQVEKDWGKVLTAVKPFNHSVEAFLRAARPAKIRKNSVVLEVFYPFHKDKLEEIKNKKIVEQGFKSVFGKDLSFSCVLGEVKSKPVIINNQTEVKPVGSDEIYNVAKEIFG